MAGYVPAGLKRRTYRVRWEIDVEAGSSREACELVWRVYMGRPLPPQADRACVFTVEWREKNDLCTEVVDLAEENR